LIRILGGIFVRQRAAEAALREIAAAAELSRDTRDIVTRCLD